MLTQLYPKEDIGSTYDIDFDKFHNMGYELVLFDVDNTLVPHGFPADDKAIVFFERLRQIGFKTCLISNNKEPRVKSFANQVGTEYIFKASKPSKDGYLEACKKLGVPSSKALFVGDQIFTDILGANNAGIYSILVKPIHPKEEIQIVLKRRLGWIVLFFYRRYKKRNEKH